MNVDEAALVATGRDDTINTIIRMQKDGYRLDRFETPEIDRTLADEEVRLIFVQGEHE